MRSRIRVDASNSLPTRIRALIRWPKTINLSIILRGPIALGAFFGSDDDGASTMALSDCVLSSLGVILEGALSVHRGQDGVVASVALAHIIVIIWLILIILFLVKRVTCAR